MRRGIFHGAREVGTADTPIPQPGRGELLIRVHACALCGSDRGGWERGSAVTPGHEAAGTVVGAGPATSVREGSFGAVFLVAYCGECGRCRAHSRGACLNKRAMLGFDANGGFAEFMVAPERCFLPVDPALHADAAIMLLDAVGTPMHALRRAGALDAPPAAAIVFGAGPVGLGTILALRAAGTATVVAVDLARFRLDFARRLGAEGVEGGSAAVGGVRAVIPGGAELVIEASGHPTAQRQALDVVAPGGQLVLLGHADVPLDVSPSRDLIHDERTVLGSEYFDPGEFADNQRLVLDGSLRPCVLITHRLPLEALDEACRLFFGGETGKVLVYPGDVSMTS